MGKKTHTDFLIKRMLIGTWVITGILFIHIQSKSDSTTKVDIIHDKITELNYKGKLKANFEEHKTIKRNKTRSGKVAAITIDDGYGDISAFVDVLNENRIKATFFMVGEISKINPDGLKKIVDNGHLLANHSYNHPQFTTLNKDEILWQLNTTRESFKEITGYDIHPYFRYPYGSHSIASDAVLAEEGWQYFYWTQNTWDWKYKEDTQEGRDFIYQEAIKNPPREAIVLLHTMSKSSPKVLPDIISWYRRNGYSFVTVDEL